MMLRIEFQLNEQNFMKVAILQFPGSNCDWDAEHAVKDVLGISANRVWHKSSLPSETEAVIVPGGFLLEIIFFVEQLLGFLLL